MLGTSLVLNVGQVLRFRPLLSGNCLVGCSLATAGDCKVGELYWSIGVQYIVLTGVMLQRTVLYIR